MAVLLEREVLAGSVQVARGYTIVGEVYMGLTVTATYQKVARFDVAVDNPFAVDELEACDHLLRDHRSCAVGQLHIDVEKDRFQGWPEQVHGDVVAIPIKAMGMQRWNAISAIQNLQEYCFILGQLNIPFLDLDCHSGPSLPVDADDHLTESTLPKFAPQVEVV